MAATIVTRIAGGPDSGPIIDRRTYACTSVVKTRADGTVMYQTLYVPVENGKIIPGAPWLRPVYRTEADQE